MQQRLFPLLAPALFSGLLFVVSIPRFDQYYLAWICLLPLFLARHWLPAQSHFALGLIAGLAWATGRTYWITETLQLYGALSLATAVATNAIQLRYQHKKSPGQVASRLGISRDAMAALEQSGLEKLRQGLEDWHRGV